MYMYDLEPCANINWLQYVPCGKGKYWSMDNTKIGLEIRRSSCLFKQRHLWMKGTNKYTEA